MILDIKLNKQIKFQRCSNIDEQCVDGDLLLMSVVEKKVVILNSASKVIWELLSQPTSFQELCDLFQLGCPAIPYVQISSSIERVLTELLQAELIG